MHISLYSTNAFIQAKQMVQDAGFGMYEWQHFAKQGFESKHALKCWDRKPYYGFGAGACSFDGMRRIKNISDVARYNQRMGQHAISA